jgi:hypothetical protein
MPSPFPGMNPYLENETVFHGFHNRLIVELSNQLVPQIRPDFIADTDVNVYIHELSGDERLVGRPDLYIARSRTVPSTNVKTQGRSSAGVIAEFPPAVDIVKVPYIKIMDRDSMELVTIIEVLSRTNKVSGADRIAYIAKRNTIRRSPVHFIEIDLLRTGEPMPLERQPDSDYRVVVSRAEERPSVTLWPIRLRDELPMIPVPLRAPHVDVALDLQQAIHQVYDLGGYADRIYRNFPQPPLHPVDAEWAESLLHI